MQEIEKKIDNLSDIVLNSKAEDIAVLFIERIKEGYGDVAAIAVFLKKLEKLQKLVFENKDVKDAINKAFEGSKSVSMYGSTVEYGPTYTHYDYTECNHPIYDAWTRIAVEANANMKKIEEHLRSLDQPEDMAVLHLPAVVMTGGGGVVETIYPPTKRQTFGAKFKV